MTYAFWSAMGGCGSTTLAVNCAYSLLQDGKSVLFVDLNQFNSRSWSFFAPAAPAGRYIGNEIVVSNFEAPQRIRPAQTRFAQLRWLGCPSAASEIGPQVISNFGQKKVLQALPNLLRCFDAVVIDVPSGINVEIFQVAALADKLVYVLDQRCQHLDSGLKALLQVAKQPNRSKPLAIFPFQNHDTSMHEHDKSAVWRDLLEQHLSSLFAALYGAKLDSAYLGQAAALTSPYARLDTRIALEAYPDGPQWELSPSLERFYKMLINSDFAQDWIYG